MLPEIFKSSITLSISSLVSAVWPLESELELELELEESVCALLEEESFWAALTTPQIAPTATADREILSPIFLRINLRISGIITHSLNLLNYYSIF